MLAGPDSSVSTQWEWTMSRDELKEIVIRVVEHMAGEGDSPSGACIFSDTPCDCDGYTTYYAVGEESETPAR